MAKKAVKKRVKKRIFSMELERTRKKVDLSRFWQEVAQAAAPGIEAYRVARAKSKAQAASTVFI